jgi:hypothetical protein
MDDQKTGTTFLWQDLKAIAKTVGGRMRALLICVAILTSMAAQTPHVQITNTTRPSSSTFKVGDEYRILITASSNQAVSVRTMRNGRTDWGPIIGWTDARGVWSTSGKYERGDFGDWAESWTVGATLADPVLRFSVDAPCHEGDPYGVSYMGSVRAVYCPTDEGNETFITPTDQDALRTPDGRTIPGHLRTEPAEAYQMRILQSGIDGEVMAGAYRQFGDDAAIQITKMIGTNALTETEISHVLAITRAAFARPNYLRDNVKDPAAMLQLLNNLSSRTDQQNLKQQITETISYVLDR